ncbi:MAG TPA: secretin N-terminal domain-containing protein [Thermoanaerobaculia bacterium]|nr:secretin N-terminal domain-containing protein [Thermoanaerobaculia bacterium]
MPLTSRACWSRGPIPLLRGVALAVGLALVVLVLAAPAMAQGEKLQVYAYTLRHQRVADAVPLVQPLLSKAGSLELRPAENTLVVRDTKAVLARLGPALRQFDHPPRPLLIEVLLVRAERASFSPVLPADALPDLLARRLREMLPYSSYAVMARTTLRSREGQAITYEMSDGFQVSFRPGSVVEGGQLKLYDFRLSRAGSDPLDKALLHSTLALRMDKPFTLALAPAESSERALVVVVTPRLDDGTQGAGR